MRLTAAAIALAFVIAGCGGGTETQESPATTPPADRPAKLPRGWQSLASPPGGFSVGLPPGWTGRPEGAGALLSSPDNLIAMSIAADRTDEALSTPLTTFAQQAAAQLKGFTDLRPSAPKPFRARYPAASVEATGTRPEGGRQRLRLIVMRPESVAVFSVLAATTAKIGSGREKAIVARVARTLRHRPVEVGP